MAAWWCDVQNPWPILEIENLGSWSKPFHGCKLARRFSNRVGCHHVWMKPCQLFRLSGSSTFFRWERCANWRGANRGHCTKSGNYFETFGASITGHLRPHPKTYIYLPMNRVLRCVWTESPHFPHFWSSFSPSFPTNAPSAIGFRGSDSTKSPGGRESRFKEVLLDGVDPLQESVTDTSTLRRSPSENGKGCFSGGSRPLRSSWPRCSRDTSRQSGSQHRRQTGPLMGWPELPQTRN